MIKSASNSRKIVVRFCIIVGFVIFTSCNSSIEESKFKETVINEFPAEYCLDAEEIGFGEFPIRLGLADTLLILINPLAEKKSVFMILPVEISLGNLGLLVKDLVSLFTNPSIIVSILLRMVLNYGFLILIVDCSDCLILSHPSLIVTSKLRIKYL